MNSQDRSAESGSTFTLFVVGRKGRLALGKKLSAVAALNLLRAQRSDSLHGQDLVVVEDRSGEPISERTLEQSAGVRPAETPAPPGDLAAFSAEGDDRSVSSVQPPWSRRDRSLDLPGRGQQAVERAQKARAEFLRVHEASMARLRAKPVLGENQLEELEWMARAVDAQLTGAILGSREIWDSIAARRERSPR